MSGVEFAAVMVAAAPLPNTGLSFASFSSDESARRFWSRSRPLNGVTRSSWNPRSYDAARCWCEATASSSCASRVICHSSAVRAACSPIDSPVRGSPFCGMDGTRYCGRTLVSAASRPCMVFARLASSRILRSFSPTAIGASEVVSEPPATPTSIWPSAILLATWIVAWRPVPHACWRSVAGVSGASLEPSTDSRVRLKSRLCLSTAPATTSPRRWPSRPKRAASPSSAAVSISWLLAVA